MDSQQSPRTNFLFVNKTQLPHTLSHNPSDEIVQVRRQVQRVSRAKAKSQALQNLRSRRSLWQPLTARRGGGATRERVGESNRQAENYIGSGPSGLPYRNQLEAHSEHAQPCDCLDLPTPCSCSRQFVQEVGGARPNDQPNAEHSLRQPPPPSFQLRQPEVDNDAAAFAYVHSSPDKERPPGRIDETTGAYPSTRVSKEDPMNIASEHLDPDPPISCPSTSLFLRQNKVNKWLGAGRIDPFSTFPVNLDKISQKCIDHFIHTMAFIEFNIEEGAPLNPSRHFAFASALSSPAALHAIVATGAVHLTSLYSGGTSVVATHHLAQSQRLLRKDLQMFDRKTCAGTVQAMAELAATEDFRGQYESSRIHLRGLRDFLSLHGGVEALEISSTVQLLSCYVCNSVSASYLPEIRMTRTLYPHSPNSIASVLNQMAESSSDASEIIRRNLSDIIAHVHELMKLLNSVVEQSYPGCHSSGVRSLWTNFFRPGNELHDMLSMSTDDKMRSGGLGLKGNHRMSCLLLLTMNLLGFIENEQSTMDYLGKLQRLFQKYDLKAHPNPRLLHFVLLQDCTLPRIGDTKMSWKAVGLMQVYKLLSAQMKEYVNNIILHFLTNCGPRLICVVPDLKFLLQDVLSALVCPEPC